MEETIYTEHTENSHHSVDRNNIIQIYDPNPELSAHKQDHKKSNNNNDVRESRFSVETIDEKHPSDSKFDKTVSKKKEVIMSTIQDKVDLLTFKN